MDEDINKPLSESFIENYCKLYPLIQSKLLIKGASESSSLMNQFESFNAAKFPKYIYGLVSGVIQAYQMNKNFRSKNLEEFLNLKKIYEELGITDENLKIIERNYNFYEKVIRSILTSAF